MSIEDEVGLPMGLVDFGGVRRRVCLAYVADQVEVGDYAIVHVGFAISRVDEEEAKRTYQILEEMSELDELDWMREVARRAAAVEAPAPGAGGGPGPAPPAPGDGP